MESNYESDKMQKTKECSLYGFIVQQPEQDTKQPYQQLVEFCQFLQSNGHPKSHRIKYKDTVATYKGIFLKKDKGEYTQVAQLVNHKKLY